MERDDDGLMISFDIDPNINPSRYDNVILICSPAKAVGKDRTLCGIHVVTNYDGPSDLLLGFRYSERAKAVTIKTAVCNYELDVKNVKAEELSAMREILTEMSSRSWTRLAGV